MKRSESYWQIAWRQLKGKKVAMAGLWFVVGLFYIGTYAPYISLDVPFTCVETDGTRLWPFFTALFDSNIFEQIIDILFNVLSFFLIPVTVVCLLVRNRVKPILAVSLALYVVASVYMVGWGSQGRQYRDWEGEFLGKEGAWFPPVPLGIKTNDTADTRQPPGTKDVRHGRTFWFGTDDKNRDVLSLLLYGVRISLTIGVLAVSIYVLIGSVLGALSGYYGGWIDNVISRFIEMMISIPTLILIIALVAFVKDRSIFHVMIVIGLTGWTRVARLVRAEFLRLRSLDFVLGAQSLGASTSRIIFRHVLPNAIGPILVTAALGVPAAILIESGLSFLGLGDPTIPSWGQILESARKTGLLPWLIHPPGLAIFLTVSAMNLLGDGVRDALDPKLRGR